MRTVRFIAITCLILSITACSSRAVVKKDVRPDAASARQDVIALNKQNPAVADDLSKADVNQELVISPDSLVEIKGGGEGLKFIDPSWKNFPITLNLNVVPLRVFFDSLHRLTGINFVVGDEVKGDVSINLKDVGWIDVMQLVIKNKNLMSEVDQSGQLVMIHTPEFVTTQSDSSQKALISRMALIQAYGSIVPRETVVIRLNYSKPDVVAQQLKDITSLVEADSKVAATGASTGSTGKQRASFIVDVRTNSIIVHASASDMGWIKSAISRLDIQTKQVLVDVFIIEASDQFEMQLGSRVGLYNTANATKGITTVGGTLGVATAPTTSVATTTGFPVDLASQANSIAKNTIANPAGALALAFTSANTDLRVELQAMQAESLIKIVSNPKLFIVENELASITDGTEIPYTVVGTLGGSPTVSFKDAALKLTVKPTVVGDGSVYLDLTVNKDTPLPGTVPPISKKELKTKLIVKSGGVAMIGGINKSEVSATDNGVPLLSKLPLIGNLFKSQGDKKNKDQLYIFLAPRVL